MKIIRNSIIPFKGFVAINLFGVLFVRKEILPHRDISMYDWERMLNYELIHTAQMKELLYIPFYLWYVTEWLIRLAMYKDTKKACRNISFEREAYDKHEDFGYMLHKERKPYAFIKYIGKKG